jgi:hypothetical protein
MAREKSYPTHPITITFLPSSRARKVKKKTFKNRNIDEVIEGLENGTLPGVSINAVIKHIGVGSCFM